MHVPDQQSNKWDLKSRELVYVGYSEELKAYSITKPVKTPRLREIFCHLIRSTEHSSS
jgi:hypothetical protein